MRRLYTALNCLQHLASCLGQAPPTAKKGRGGATKQPTSKKSAAAAKSTTKVIADHQQFRFEIYFEATSPYLDLCLLRHRCTQKTQTLIVNDVSNLQLRARTSENLRPRSVTRADRKSGGDLHSQGRILQPFRYVVVVDLSMTLARYPAAPVLPVDAVQHAPLTTTRTTAQLSTPRMHVTLST